ncbi:hypothetical protein EV356DRAFT_500671 [Viridothelium virens]|uniref:Uncharacterized protein n=1 Tax=Viridothelium virens TaxID=1048519 RepID=A0A6A6HB80_VIRVR|nr:hypothetical protein EV356DRAFT_500671 [Viridothelium virens]
MSSGGASSVFGQRTRSVSSGRDEAIGNEGPVRRVHSRKRAIERNTEISREVDRSLIQGHVTFLRLLHSSSPPFLHPLRSTLHASPFDMNAGSRRNAAIVTDTFTIGRTYQRTRYLQHVDGLHGSFDHDFLPGQVFGIFCFLGWRRLNDG